MNSSLTDISIPSYAAEALGVLKASGFEAYAVGGCVRDSLLGKTPYDWDITTGATPDEMKACFSDYRVIETGIKHGTLTVRIDGHSLEITTFRADGDYLDHRHPVSVAFSRRLEDDLSRRDFTVNAMCYAPESGITDFFGGREDLEKGIIRCVGNAEKRFDEDALRIMRALRFAATLGFEVEEKTAEAIHRQKALLHSISAERIYAEMKKMLTGLKRPSVICEFRDVFEEIFPQIKKISPASFAEACEKAREGEGDAMSLALFLSPLGNDDIADIMSVLKADGKTRGTVLFLNTYKNTGLSDREDVFRIVREAGADKLNELGIYRKILSEAFDDSAVKSVINDLQNGLPADVNGLAISGRDIAALGFSGADIGFISRKLLAAVWGGKLDNSKQQLSDYIKNELK